MIEQKGCFWCAKLESCIHISDKNRNSIKQKRAIFEWGVYCKGFISKRNSREEVQFT